MRTHESAYDRRRLRQWLAGEARADGVSRRDMLRLLAAAGAAGAAPVALGTPARAAATAPGIVKPLPEELFTVRGTNAETRFAALAGTGYHTPNDRFFVRNHTSTPVLSAADWALTVHGDGLTRDRTVDFSLADLRKLPSVTHSAFVECAGNGRSLFTGQQGQTVGGTSWALGAIGVARWRGVRLADVLRRAGLSRRAVDVMPRGLDADYVTADGAGLGRVRRPLPLSKALDDVLLAYEMNGEPLPPDHGHPVRVLVPSWIGIASIKWVGDIEVSAEPLYSPWNTDFYRLFGDAYPDGGPRRSPGRRSRAPGSWTCRRTWRPGSPTGSPAVPGPARVESSAWTSALTEAPPGTGPGSTTRPGATAGSAGPPAGARRRRARTPCSRGRRTARAGPSPTRPSTTRRATCSTRSCGTRSTPCDTRTRDGPAR